MATYKVPQDVEAEDKIIGFLSLKQFIFVIVMIASLWMCWWLAAYQIFLGLIPLPIAIVSGVLGLYQRSDQPVEVYLASWLRFKTKPRRRKWDQEGLEERVIITAPKTVEKNYTKGLSQTQVENRLNQLSSLLDSRGWASKHGAQAINTGQRLFNADELSRYARPTLPLDGESSHVIDQYDANDPRNRTVQEVNRDFGAVEKRQRAEALHVVEQARKEALQSVPTTPASTPAAPVLAAKTGPAKVRAHTPPQTSGQPRPPQPARQQAKPQPKADENANGEVVINLHHKK